MTAEQFREWLKAMRISAADAARLLKVNANTITRYRRSGGSHLLELACSHLLDRKMARDRWAAEKAQTDASRREKLSRLRDEEANARLGSIRHGNYWDETQTPCLVLSVDDKDPMCRIAEIKRIGLNGQLGAKEAIIDSIGLGHPPPTPRLRFLPNDEADKLIAFHASAAWARRRLPATQP